MRTDPFVDPFTFTFTILRYEAVAREPEGPLERSRNKFMLCRP